MKQYFVTGSNCRPLEGLIQTTENLSIRHHDYTSQHQVKRMKQTCKAHVQQEVSFDFDFTTIVIDIPKYNFLEATS